ncbi:MAG: ABC transporter substrate-binding protein [Oscillospiraceae bacterium]|nr:ABC transporter substrate-binding protein [Oscillospiraceae bacterium]
MLIAVICLAPLSGCGDGGEPADATTLPVLPTAKPPEQNDDTLTLPFANRDVINPYLAASQLNQELGTLLYEGLFTVDDRFAPVPVLAEKMEQGESLTDWVVTLRQGRVFHSGAKVTPEDVAYSFLKAKGCALYQARLAQAKSLRAREDGTLLLTLSQANAYIAANLDFPIVPAGSADEKKLAQAEHGYSFNRKTTPVGTGRYRLAQTDGSFHLSYDERHPGPKPLFTTIALHGVNDTKSLLYGLEMGSYQFAYDDLSEGRMVRVGASAAHVRLTNLIFLGVNQNRAPLNDPALRQAIAACINKSGVVGEAFHGYARAADTPFPPEWHGIEAKEFAQPFDREGAKKRLEDLGYKQFDKSGTRTSKGRALKFSLIVNSGNDFKLAAANALRAQLAAFQISVEIRPLKLEDYQAAVKKGQFDLYLGEVKLTPDCSLSPLLLQDGAATAGINVWGKASNAYGQMLQGLVTPAQFIGVFREETPFIPLGYRNGMAAVTRGMRMALQCRQNDLFYDIANWKG